MVAECYVHHLTGISESQYVTAESNATAPDRSETEDLNSADNECQKALTSLASLVDNTNPAGLTNTSNLGS
jgi:pectin methylesterase-like acyl-CoA thioesterase